MLLRKCFIHQLPELFIAFCSAAAPPEPSVCSFMQGSPQHRCTGILESFQLLCHMVKIVCQKLIPFRIFSVKNCFQIHIHITFMQRYPPLLSASVFLRGIPVPRQRHYSSLLPVRGRLFYDIRRLHPRRRSIRVIHHIHCQNCRLLSRKILDQLHLYSVLPFWTKLSGQHLFSINRG